MKHQVDYLDLVMIRSCQLACEGCCTFSDHKHINGLSDLVQAEKALAHWLQYITPARLHLFGGEPTMHPKLIEWFRMVHRHYDQTVWLNTNGYFLDKLFDHIKELFFDQRTSISVTHHTTDEPYSSLVLENYSKLQYLIIEEYRRQKPSATWEWKSETQWDTEYKKFLVLTDGYGVYVILSITLQYLDFFVSHYKGHGPTLEPWHNYNDSDAKLKNHNVCHIKNYVQLYEGKLWKCPPRAVLNQTLETYNLQNNPEWLSYYRDYKPLDLTASENEINEWFKRQNEVENTCNMCGFMYRHQNIAKQHLPKKLFKIKLS